MAITRRPFLLDQGEELILSADALTSAERFIELQGGPYVVVPTWKNEGTPRRVPNCSDELSQPCMAIPRRENRTVAASTTDGFAHGLAGRTPSRLLRSKRRTGSTIPRGRGVAGHIAVRPAIPFMRQVCSDSRESAAAIDLIKTI
jgi:hypothetical protein